MRNLFALLALATIGATTAAIAHPLEARQVVELCREQLSINSKEGEACMRVAASMPSHEYTIRIEIDGQPYSITAEDGRPGGVRAGNVGVEIVPKGADSKGRVILAYHIVDFADDKDAYGRGPVPNNAILPVGMTAKVPSLAGRQVSITIESMHD